MADLVSIAASIWEGKIDFAGQTDSERFGQVGLVASVVIAFLVGIIAQDIRLCLGVFGFGVILTIVASAPKWPYFNSHPVQWRSSAVQLKKDA